VSSLEEVGGRLLVIFDGHCGLCNAAVRWLLRHDRRDRLRFAASEQPAVAALLARFGFNGLDPALPGTVLAVRDAGGSEERLIVRSDAVFALFKELPRPWPAVAAALGWIPRPLRDQAYRLIARWRYCIWGRLDICPLPKAGMGNRFL
jgi:predicted DCC family thiol-disulfide oxidoreductase YuxK